MQIFVKANHLKHLQASQSKSSYEFTIPVASGSTVAQVKLQKGDIKVSPAMWY